ncbi:hypothetical protein B0H66DRAFT_18261 [Apodospora peruviana]|uniref:Uncharacterized protein n=1 Tax=Apodospora peruviana TaxID=516989 RepID=A0AAE0IQQ1_9PEZI|nr:hypothetical protein B0H66DRAFT_18261 [Apodospora peruviana]
MSWMDSWSRPNKHQATPAPFYLLPGGENVPYCKSCGRTIGSRKSGVAILANSSNHGNKKSSSKDAGNNASAGHSGSQTAAPPTNAVKYCSSRCRNKKPGKLDREIEDAFVKFLIGEESIPPDRASTEVSHHGGSNKKTKKGDAGRILVSCDVVEDYVFKKWRGEEAAANAAEKTFGRKKNRASRVLKGPSSDKDEDEGVSLPSSQSRAEPHDGDHGMDHLKPPNLELGQSTDAASQVLDGDVLARMSVRSGTRIRPPQTVSEVNGSVGGEKGWAERIEETDEMREKRIEGQKRTHEKEMIRCAARRGVVFGFNVSTGAGEEGKKCEAVMQGKVVEPSFAKGDWGVRWRE